jgi:hypothetical protein
MDLTRFMHGGSARLMTCPALLSHLYPRYVRAFEEKRSQYLAVLRNGAEVLELGSHLGTFLQTAEQWRWRPRGLDIGESSRAFARNQGVSVKRLAPEDCC